MGKREERREKRHREQLRTRLILGLIGVFFGALLVLAIIASLPKDVSEENVVRPVQKEYEMAVDNTIGNPDAPVMIEVFSDFMCGHCANFALNLKNQITEDYIDTGKVYFVYVPYNFLTDESVLAGEAVYCAMEQGVFWPYHDILYANQTNEAIDGFNQKTLTTFAEMLGLDVASFRNCLKSGKYYNKNRENLDYGKRLGVTGTPSFVINGGEPVFASDLVEAIEKALVEDQ